jgi:hypothetical protein
VQLCSLQQHTQVVVECSECTTTCWYYSNVTDQHIHIINKYLSTSRLQAGPTSVHATLRCLQGSSLSIQSGLSLKACTLQRCMLCSGFIYYCTCFQPSTHCATTVHDDGSGWVDSAFASCVLHSPLWHALLTSKICPGKLKVGQKYSHRFSKLNVGVWQVLVANQILVKIMHC